MMLLLGIAWLLFEPQAAVFGIGLTGFAVANARFWNQGHTSMIGR